ncbi:putative Endonuclease/exonuclease/phosphatase protein [Anopheles sinensis]|uniref:Putative Endonuclease/exonuclease/phosphatase protein n=1 Tax=Anopheles sinensis TaxID=74873 RepID=A0A084WJJ4_ANOSI|nr:putative Endonuclease/exonuclease/phosphatase protein [Anopheles sinensis]
MNRLAPGRTSSRPAVPSEAGEKILTAHNNPPWQPPTTQRRAGKTAHRVLLLGGHLSSDRNTNFNSPPKRRRKVLLIMGLPLAAERRLGKRVKTMHKTMAVYGWKRKK